MIQLYMLDTNTVSYILKGKSKEARDRLAGLSVDEVACISVITEAELRFGLEKCGAGPEKVQAVERFLMRIKVYPWGKDEAAAYGALRAKQEAAGRPSGPLDMMIAAHAISVGAFLVSSDGAFEHVQDLRGLEDWSRDRIQQAANG